MILERRRNGFLELKFNDDRTQALATIYPPVIGGEPVAAADVLTRLKALGVTYGIRDHIILEAIHHASARDQPSVNVVVAQGVTPQEGQDAKIRYVFDVNLLLKPLLRNSHGLPDWFTLDPAKLVVADQELATILPAQPGVPGKTLTWPIQNIPCKPGKPAALSAGSNVAASSDGLRLTAGQDGYVCLQGETLTLHALRVIDEEVDGGEHSYPAGAVFTKSLQQTRINALGFIAVQGIVKDCYIRAFGDVYLDYAENAEIVASGDVFIMHGCRNCEITTRKRVIAFEHTFLIGGRISATDGVEAGVIGAEDYTATDVMVGTDQFSPIRMREIEQELRETELNIERISRALKPFAALAVHSTLPEDKRQLFNRLQNQKRSQEMHAKDLHVEKRLIGVGARGKLHSSIRVSGTVHPGVWVRVSAAATQIESPISAVEFVDSQGGKSVLTRPMQQAA